MHNCNCIGQLFWQFVVIRHNDIHTIGHQPIYFFTTRDTIVDCNQQLHPFASQALILRHIRPVAVVKTVRHIITHIGTHQLKGPRHNGCTGNTIDIIITVHNDLFTVVDSGHDSVNCHIHIVQQKRIIQCIHPWTQKGIGTFNGVIATIN